MTSIAATCVVVGALGWLAGLSILIRVWTVKTLGMSLFDGAGERTLVGVDSEVKHKRSLVVPLMLREILFFEKSLLPLA